MTDATAKSAEKLIMMIVDGIDMTAAAERVLLHGTAMTHALLGKSVTCVLIDDPYQDATPAPAFPILFDAEPPKMRDISLPDMGIHNRHDRRRFKDKPRRRLFRP